MVKKMKILNQNDYPNIEYKTNLNDKTSHAYLEGSIESSGCGLCCLIMMIEQLTTDSLSIEEAIKLSYDNEANLKVGTNMRILGPIIAEKYDLSYETTNDEEVMIKHLQNGGCAIINTGGNREGYKSIFCHVGHYILAIGYTNPYVRILDPDYKVSKYDTQNTVVDKKGILYATKEVLHQETDNRTPKYYLFNTAI